MTLVRRDESKESPRRLLFSMLQQVLAVFLVLGILLTALWILRQKGLTKFHFAGVRPLTGRKCSERHLEVLERVALTPQHSLHLVSIQGEKIVFAVSPSGCHPIDPGWCIRNRTMESDTKTSNRGGASAC